ncbi:MAG: nucleoside diphosphate kinase regulator [Pseudomonadota bacterium]
MQTIETRGAMPPIHIANEDYDAIADLALRMADREPGTSRLILDELDRARLHPAGKLPENVVRLGSDVEFFDDLTGTSRRVRLVLPWQADSEAACLSVMTPVGTALMGMSVGQQISWPGPNGRQRTLEILQVG